MADVASIAVESENRNWTSLRFVGGAKQESTESFAVGCWNREFFVVFDAVLRGPRDVCACSWWDVARVDDLTVEALV